MPHVVTGRCVDCRYTDCCAVCPTDSFFQVDSPAMLVIDPNVCADCGACAPECPVYAIYPEDEVPAPYGEWIGKNAELAPKGKLIKEKTSALPGAVAIDAIHERERARGWTVADPSAVGGGSPPPAAAAPAAPPKAEAKPPATPPPETKPPPPAPAPAAAPTPKASAPAAAVPAPMAAAPAAAAKAGPDAKAPPPAPVTVGPPPPAPPLEIRRGARIRLEGKAARVLEVRKGSREKFQEVKVLFEKEGSPIWYGFGPLRTLQGQGKLEVLDPGPKPGILARLLGR